MLGVAVSHLDLSAETGSQFEETPPKTVELWGGVFVCECENGVPEALGCRR